MHPRLIYTLDQKLFGFLCHCVGLFVTQNRPNLHPSEWKRIAVAKYMGMGSLILATPLLQLLQRECPNAEVTVVTLRQHQDLVDMLPVHRSFLWDLSDWEQSVKSFFPFIKSLRQWNPDAFFDLEFFVNVSALISWFSGAKVRVGFHHAQSQRGKLLTHRLPITPRHTVDLFLGLAWCVGLEVKNPPSICKPKYDVNKIRPEILQLQRPFIVINPNAGELSLQRRWIPERFREVTKQLLEEFPIYRFCILGTASEKDYVTLVLGDLLKHPRVINLAGKLSMNELCFILEQASVLITNDSGPMHLASALGTSCVALFGPETPTHYGPLGSGHKVFYKPPPCSPCLNPFDGKLFVCPFEVQCLRQINTQEVITAVAELIRQADA